MKKRIITFDMMESTNVWHFCLINYLKDERIVKIVDNEYSVNQVIAILIISTLLYLYRLLFKTMLHSNLDF